MAARRLVAAVLGGVGLVGSLLTGAGASALPDCGDGRLLPAVGEHPPACEHVLPPPPGVDLDAPVTLADLAGRGGALDARTAQDRPRVPCDGDGEDAHRVQALYVYDPSRPGSDRYDDVVPLIRVWAAGVDHVFQLSADKTGGQRRVRWVTEPDGSGGCVVAVAKVATRTGALDDQGMSRMMTDLIMAGHGRADRRYLAWAEATAVCGLGTFSPGDTRPGQDNLNNGSGGPAYARVDAPCWGFQESVEAHEVMHTLGAVLNPAPNSSGSGHCTDEYDAMCYDDDNDGPTVMRQVCPMAEATLFDCNNDDYFSTNPIPGSWLATHWNTADSRFLVGGGDGTRGGTPGHTRVELISDPGPAGAPTPLRVTVTTPGAHRTTWATGTDRCTVTDSGDTATLQCPASVRQAQVTAYVHRADGGQTSASHLVSFGPPGEVTVTAGGVRGPRITACLPGTGTARVHVADTAGGSDLQDVPVRITRRGTEVARGTTGPDGVALIDVPATGTAIFEVSLTGEFDSHRRGYVTIANRCTATLEDLTLPYTQVPAGGPAVATGTATNAGAPVENLPVTLTHPGGTVQTRTDATGRFQVTWPHTTAGPVRVGAGGTTRDVGTLATRDWRTGIVVHQQGTGDDPALVGLVYRLTADGLAQEPLAGANITVTAGTTTRTATTGEQGWFRIGVPATQAGQGTAWTVTATAPGHEQATATGTFGRHLDALIMTDVMHTVPGDPSILLGIILDGQRRPTLDGARVVVDLIAPDGTVDTHETTNNGSWRVDVPAAGMRVVAIRAETADGGLTADIPRLESGLPLSTDLTITRITPGGHGSGPRVRGRLVLAGTTPADLGVGLAGRRVVLEHDIGGTGGSVETVMNPDGTFHAELPPATGNLTVTARMDPTFPFWQLRSAPVTGRA